MSRADPSDDGPAPTADPERNDDPLQRQRRFFEDRVVQQDLEHPGYAAAWSEFSSTVLRNGGALVVPPRAPDPMIGMLGEQATLVVPAEVVHRTGEQSECHANVAALWRSGEVVAIGTGYALSRDSLWREHSWGWDESGRLVETTELRERYFGVRLQSEGAERFANWITPEAAD